MRVIWLAVGALNGLLAVAAGAFAAHTLENTLPPERLDPFKTAAQYHLIHALAMCIAAIVHRAAGYRSARYAAIFFFAGILLFCGSLYGLALSGIRQLGMITPFGGVAFLAGWACLAWAGFSRQRSAER
jgi:uncharacterized membrane protein YgdD (TMEM256/DUF423 family)